ncbi:MAG: ABC transporter ATP-binding protein [Bacteroidota bacterium]
MKATLSARSLRKTFNRRVIFDNISFEAGMGQTILVSGRNGSGKSTLVKLLSRVLTPSGGTITLSVDDRTIPEIAWPEAVGLVSPYFQLYDEFTARENIELALTLRGKRPDHERITEMLQEVSLLHRADDPVRTYSSGMKQRVKLAFALVGRPQVLFLDEPMTNLDAEGIALVRRIMERQRERGILIVATNDLTDVQHYDGMVDLNAQH